jgi:hypothetical protein
MEIQMYNQIIGEWHEDELHGIAKYEDPDRTEWRQYKHGKIEGYGSGKYRHYG